MVAKAGVVHEHIDAQPAFVEPAEKLLHARFVGEVEAVAENGKLRVQPRKLVTQGVEPVEPPRDKHQRPGVRRKLACEFESESRRGSGDQRGALIEVFHQPGFWTADDVNVEGGVCGGALCRGACAPRHKKKQPASCEAGCMERQTA